MHDVNPRPRFDREEMLGLSCAQCDAPMTLILIEPEQPGFDRRAFQCPDCGKVEIFKVKIWR
jgi:predicted RNA-binding Zn-ribbon protein involved in translation (DUF1610 family)